MGDIVEHLRIRAQRQTATGITEPHEHIDWMAADEITILRGQVEALDNERNNLWADKLKMQGEITRLREENAQLRNALQPFVDRLGVLEETIVHKYAIGTNIDVEHLRAARAAIQEGGKDDAS